MVKTYKIFYIPTYFIYFFFNDDTGNKIMVHINDGRSHSFNFPYILKDNFFDEVVRLVVYHQSIWSIYNIIYNIDIKLIIFWMSFLTRSSFHKNHVQFWCNRMWFMKIYHLSKTFKKYILIINDLMTLYLIDT